MGHGPNIVCVLAQAPQIHSPRCFLAIPPVETCIKSLNSRQWLIPVIPASGDWEDHGSRPAWANKLCTPIIQATGRCT
jgi:hypothetical protein